MSSFRHRLSAYLDLWRHYVSVFKYFWAQRKEIDPPQLQQHEAEFLPAALALQNAPISPTGIWTGRVLIGIILFLLVWSILGKDDIIAPGTGKIISTERTKTISVVEVATVTAIHVEEGQQVKKGDLLFELNTKAYDSEREKAESNRLNAMMTQARGQAMLLAIDSGSPPKLGIIDGATPEKIEEAKTHLSGQWEDYKSKVKQVENDISRYTSTLPIATKTANDYAELAKDRAVSQQAASEKRQIKLDMEAQLNDAKNKKNSLLTETRKTIFDQLNDAQRIIKDAELEKQRTSARSEQLKILAPVDGTVQQLVVHTVGAAISAAQPLMQIVPLESSVEVEAMIQNKDIGFVHPGQRASVKIETFDSSKYGAIEGKVSHVSQDAIQDQQKGLLYSVKILLDKSRMFVDDRYVSLSPGMSVQIEIKTGERRIIEYFLSPLKKHAQEGLRER